VEDKLILESGTLWAELQSVLETMVEQCGTRGQRDMNLTQQRTIRKQ